MGSEGQTLRQLTDKRRVRDLETSDRKQRKGVVSNQWWRLLDTGRNRKETVEGEETGELVSCMVCIGSEFDLVNFFFFFFFVVDWDPLRSLSF